MRSDQGDLPPPRNERGEIMERFDDGIAGNHRIGLKLEIERQVKYGPARGPVDLLLKPEWNQPAGKLQWMLPPLCPRSEFGVQKMMPEITPERRSKGRRGALFASRFLHVHL